MRNAQNMVIDLPVNFWQQVWQFFEEQRSIKYLSVFFFAIWLSIHTNKKSCIISKHCVTKQNKYWKVSKHKPFILQKNFTDQAFQIGLKKIFLAIFLAIV